MEYPIGANYADRPSEALFQEGPFEREATYPIREHVRWNHDFAVRGEGPYQ